MFPKVTIEFIGRGSITQLLKTIDSIAIDFVYQIYCYIRKIGNLDRIKNVFKKFAN